MLAHGFFSLSYFTRLLLHTLVPLRFLPTPIRPRTAHQLPTSASSTFPLQPHPLRSLHTLRTPSRISYKDIHQTDKTNKTLGAETQAWIDLNKADGWRLSFFDDR